MLSEAKHPSGITTTINAAGIPHFIRNDIFPVKVGRAYKHNMFGQLITADAQC